MTTFIDRWVEDLDRKLNLQIKNSISEMVTRVFEATHEWFIGVLPDLVGYGTLATGAAVIGYSLAGQGMMKPLGIYSCVLIVSLCILAGT